MRSQLELTIIALIFFFIFTNKTILETINKLFVGFLGDEQDQGIRHSILQAVLFGLCYFITLLIVNRNPIQKTIDSYNNKAYDDYEDCD